MRHSQNKKGSLTLRDDNGMVHSQSFIEIAVNMYGDIFFQKPFPCSGLCCSSESSILANVK